MNIWRWLVGEESLTRQAAIKQLLLKHAAEDRRAIKYAARDDSKVVMTEWAQHTARLRAKHRRRA